MTPGTPTTTTTTPTDLTRLEARRRPGDPAVMYQRWRDLLFLHWRVDPETIRATLPPGLHVDLHEGAAYLGLVPFEMRGVRPRFLPPVPGLSRFPEMNVRTYVHDDAGRPGVWFYSLEADQAIAVAIARRFFHLPYLRAAMSLSRESGRIRYRCRRRGAEPAGTSHFTYGGDGQRLVADPGTLAFFLVERYVLFAHDERAGRLHAGRVHHAPYELEGAESPEFDTLALRQAGFDVGDRPPDHVLFSPGVDVEVFPLETIEMNP